MKPALPLLSLLAVLIAASNLSCQRQPPAKQDKTGKESVKKPAKPDSSNAKALIEPGEPGGRPVETTLPPTATASSALNSASVPLKPNNALALIQKSPPHDSLFLTAAKLWKDKPVFGFCHAPIGDVEAQPQILLHHAEEKNGAILGRARMTVHCYLHPTPTLLEGKSRPQFLATYRYDLSFLLTPKGNGNWTAKVIGPASSPKNNKEIRP